MRNPFTQHAGDGQFRDGQKTVAELIPSPTDDDWTEGWCLAIVGAPPPSGLKTQGYYKALESITETHKPSPVEIFNARIILITRFNYQPKDLPQ